MSEEEIIETLVNLAVDKYIDEIKLEEKDIEAIINIMVLYKQKKEYIKENEIYQKSLFDSYKKMEDLYNKEKKKNNELENADLTTVYMNGFYDGEKKWKEHTNKLIRYIALKENKDYEKVKEEFEIGG